ncbi:MAG: response regulator [Anaerolineae bacterium]|nr:response regulator [Anaerolineae bacterium]
MSHNKENNPLALIIEDDPKLADIFNMALKEAKYDTEIINDGKLALAKLAETVPSVVLLDLHLPGVSGSQILEHIRSDDRLAATRVMLATADTLMAEKLRSKANIVLLKPISFSQLRDLASRLRPKPSP